MRAIWLGRLRAAAIGLVLGLLLLYPEVAMGAARAACRSWAMGVMPALFPYMVFSQLLASGTRGGLFTVPLAMMGGSPSGARLIQIAGYPRERAQRLAALCATVSPLFVLGTLSGGWQMLAAHWLGAAVSCAAVRLTQRKAPTGHADAPGRQQPQGARAGLLEAVRDGALAMLNVCGCMAIFGVLAAVLTRALPVSPGISALLSSVLEMAGGCDKIRALGLPPGQEAPLLCAAISFGGLSIFMQNAGFLRPAGISLPRQLFAKIVHAAAAYGLCCLFVYLGAALI